MSQIICNVNVFDLNQTIYLIDEYNAQNVIKTTNLTILGNDIAKVCQQKKCYKVHLFGSQVYLEDMVIPQIKEYLGSTFGLDKLELEVN